MRVYDQIAAVVKSGGKTRRAAKMQSLKVWHPDILDFVECKWKEEQKAHTLIESGKYEANFNGEAYSSILFQNANLSVRVTDEFMETVRRGGKWTTRWVSGQAKSEPPSHDAKELLNRMAECAWACGDPGVQYDTTINRWHTCPNSGRINASNPCSEYMFLDDTACNLSSINLMKLRRPDGTFDVDRFKAVARLFFIAQEILVDRASYPTDRIAENSHLYRPLGLGYSNLGGLLMSCGIPYDSDAAYGVCGSLTALLHGAGNLASAELAGVVGPFEAFADNREPMLRVMQMHRDAVEQINDAGPAELKDAARRVWNEVLELGREQGFRNAQATVLAPTGTISFMMDCDTTGIEPDIALVKYKQLAGGGMLKIVNNTVPMALNSLGYDDPEIKAITDYIDQHDTVEGAPHLDVKHLPVFDCAFKPANGTRSIAWRAHVRMMAAAQPFLSGAISKTVNMPSDTTPKEIAEAYMWGWEMGLKALAIYRDGSKQSQPLSTKSEKAKKEAEIVYRPRRERLPDTRQSITHKFNVGGHEGYINVGLYPDGRPGELFITMAKEGSTIGGLMDSFGTAISICLQYGVPLEVLVNKFSHTRFDPMGHTTNPDIRIAKSVVDYIFRWAGITFLDGYREASNGLPMKGEDVTEPATKAASQSDSKSVGAMASPATNGHAQKGADRESQVDLELLERAGLSVKLPGTQATRSDQFARFQSDAPACDNCGAITVRNGNCYLCHNCGNSMGCS
jgi:ribonucleoside-diphosphate reductase alpha chain